MNNSIISDDPGRRRTKDRIAQWIISAGGLGVLLSVLTILLYLTYEVVPLFKPAEVTSEGASVSLSSNATPLLLTVEELGEIALLVERNGQARFFELHDGNVLFADRLAITPPIAAIARDSAPSKLMAVAGADGQVALYRRGYRLTYPDGRQMVTPRLDLEHTINLGNQDGESLLQLAVVEARDRLVLAWETASGRLLVEVLAGEDAPWNSRTAVELPVAEGETGAYLFLDESQRWLVRVDADGGFQLFDIRSGEGESPNVFTKGRLFKPGVRPVAFATLQGGHAFVASGSNGEIGQFFPAIDQAGKVTLVSAGKFELDGAVATHLVEDPSGRAFAALSNEGSVGLFQATTAERLISMQLQIPGKPAQAAMSSEGNVLAILSTEQSAVHWRLNVPHPEVSVDALFRPVLYEGYTEPRHKWQSSSATDDYEAKLGLTPLLFGTLKAALYTMLFAIPVAISAAIFTGYFMAPGLRRPVKPVIELMEALPTVVLGFLAGMWLAPLIEKHLAAVAIAAFLLPTLVLLTGALWGFVPPRLRRRLPPGWEPVVLVPVLIAACMLATSLGQIVENEYLGAAASVWVEQRWNLDYSQRNALVVGIAMGLAVIPTIFSIAEDAVFSVPRHLSDGSLALGASKWQTLRNVVLPAASPGIFSALMIGLGRAVGETMIVLMATGNTPLMEGNLFSGMRTLSANIAVEIPEAATGSSHYRVLIVSALMLFVLTFILNSLAELLRQRLRRQYGAL